MLVNFNPDINSLKKLNNLTLAQSSLFQNIKAKNVFEFIKNRDNLSDECDWARFSKVPKMTLATFNGKCDNENNENKECIDNETKPLRKNISTILVAALECNFLRL
jgi:hypothetical protein